MDWEQRTLFWEQLAFESNATSQLRSTLKREQLQKRMARLPSRLSTWSLMTFYHESHWRMFFTVDSFRIYSSQLLCAWHFHQPEPIQEAWMRRLLIHSRQQPNGGDRSNQSTLSADILWRQWFYIPNSNQMNRNRRLYSNSSSNTLKRFICNRPIADQDALRLIWWHMQTFRNVNISIQHWSWTRIDFLWNSHFRA